jgi:hypothetical protein
MPEMRMYFSALMIFIEGCGMPFLQLDVDRSEHPLDIIERIATLNHWSFDRDEQDEISISVAGGWSEYTVAFTWLAEVEALHVACSFPLNMPEARRPEIASLVSLINEELWIGHYDVWPNEELVMFRHAILLTGGAALNAPQCQTALAIAVRACERYYQAFQFAAWAGKTGKEALATVMFETQGRA